MTSPIHVLILEDQEVDSELIEHELRREGLAFQSHRVAGEADYAVGLRDPELRLILSDNRLPGYDGLAALALARRERPEVPFIFVTGTLGEEAAIDALHHGATDYVLKQRLSRLRPAVRRALAELGERERLREAEDALRAADTELRHILAHSPAVLYTRVIEGEVVTPVFVSDNVQAVLGVSVAASSRYAWWLESLHPHDRERVVDAVRRGSLAGGHRVEYRLRHGDGTYRWIEDSARVVGVAGGGRRRLVGLWTDVTVRKDLEAEVRLQQQRLAAFFAGAPAGMVLVDRELRYVMVNDALATIDGVPAAAHIGRTVREVLPPIAPGLEALLAQVLATGEVVRNVELEGAPSPETDTARQWLISGFPVTGADGALVGVGAVVVGITEMKRTQAALLESERRFRSLVNAMDDSVFILDRDERLVGAHGKFPVGTEQLGRPWCEVHGPEAAALHHRAARRAMAGESVLYEWSFDDQTGRRCLQTRLSPMRSEAGEITGIVGVGRDVTDLKKIQAGLVASERMASVGLLAAGVAHEINNPLSVITANLEIAAKDLAHAGESGPAPAAVPEVGECLGDALEAAARVRDIVRDLKVFSRSDDTAPPAIVRPEAVLESAARMAGNEIKHRARLVRDYQAVPPVRANESRLGQVFLNLLVNAAQAIPEGHAEKNEIRVSTRTGDDLGAVIEVADTGAGMSPEIVERLFTPFFTTKPVGVGTGLGLSICHRIVEALGGRIAVESAPGRGTTFRVLLPPAAASAEVAPEPRPAPEPAPAPGAPRRGTVLVVDDETEIAKTVKRLFAGEHEVVTMTRAADAIGAIAGGRRFDVILCDLLMPQTTGMELYDEVTRVAPDQARRMIFVTGGEFTGSAQKFLEEVPNDRLDKPVDIDQLRAVVNAHVR